MLVDSLLKSRVLEAVNAKEWLDRSTNNGWSPSWPKAPSARGGLRAGLWVWRHRLSVSDAAADGGAHLAGEASARTVTEVPARRLPTDRGKAALGRLPSWPRACDTISLSNV
jgi:hypothetical protein